MNVLIIGSGGREHALSWKIAASPLVNRVFVAPGNAGTATESDDIENVEINELDFAALIKFAKQNKAGLTVVGSETPLCAGIVDAFNSENLRIFGPDKAAAQLEGSKSFCKDILHRGDVPTASYNVFNDYNDAIQYLQNRDVPLVVKADGLAAGKGVIVCRNRSEAIDAVYRIQKRREFGDAGKKIVIEERLDGEEVSVLAITDGKTILTLQPAQDHKAAHDGDAGPNTGGMGAYSPAPIVDDKMLQWIEERILVPTVHTMNSNNTPFKGVLYAGLMITKQGPKVLEYNVRFGDPECQPLLMRLRTDIVEIFEAVIDGKLNKISLPEWDKRSAVCVVMASKGYPGEYSKGDEIRGLNDAANLPDTKVFHAGTTLKKNESKPLPETAEKQTEKQIVTNGGRVLGVTALGKTISDAKLAAYTAVKKIRWDGAWCRKDISDKANKYENLENKNETKEDEDKV
ncbi:MAG: phosphoribosylamine--glycine ligase [Planctomycetaceae bacterium]|jgi:phosphoribosylamine--glycine ligase|nr:phosphoribosylamine--glycine ligase [Planctomycetaceae bacterium]